MPIKFISRKAVSRKLKATVQQGGKLGFSSTAIEDLGLREGMAVMLGQDDVSPSNMLLYMKVLDSATEDSYPILKGGDYFSASTRDFFDHIKLDYRTKKIIYDIAWTTVEGEKVLKLTGRVVGNKSVIDRLLSDSEEDEE